MQITVEYSHIGPAVFKALRQHLMGKENRHISQVKLGIIVLNDLFDPLLMDRIFKGPQQGYDKSHNSLID
ncbi:hypothetical protein D3C81_2284710 [compost metagenome]